MEEGSRSPTRLRRLLLTGDLLLVAAAFLLAYGLRFGNLAPWRGAHEHASAHLVMALAVLAAWPLALLARGLYDPAHFRPSIKALARIAQAALLVALVTAALMFLAQAKLASRLVFAGLMGASALLLWLWRALFGAILADESAAMRVIVVGAGAAAAGLRAHLAGCTPVPTIVGYLAVSGEPRAAATEPILGTADDLERIVDTLPVDHVVVATSGLPADRIADVWRACHDAGLDVSLALAAVPRALPRAIPARLGDLPVLHFAGSPQFDAVIAAKRALDVAASALLLVATAPVLALAALAVRLSSPGPVLFVQERVGLNGRRFRLYKLRTMVQGAERLRGELAPLNEVRGPAFKMRGDPRVTVVGRLLRRWSIDELPQLVNVLRGEMSLVGPRPPLPEEAARYARRQRRRLSMRPGITGAWQVSGRSDLDFDTWVQLDLDYIDHWSVGRDLRILARTLVVVLSGRGAR
jgi:exopolysaccharide biosynthesis polyprenyl glycosylphosphotransferase